VGILTTSDSILQSLLDGDLTEVPVAALDGRLAADGGTPVVPNGRLMHSRWPHFDEGDIDGIVAIVRRGLLTEMSARDLMHAFEADMAMYVGTRYAMTTNSGTAALHAALAAVGVEAGDEVIVPALSYIACAASVVHNHAIPILVDVDPFTYNVTPALIESCITSRTRAVMVVHLHGLPADVDALRAVTDRHGIALIEDFSQAVGARYHGRPVGGLAAVGAASLMAGKNLPSGGEGGILVTNDRALRNRAARLKCFGEEIDVGGQHQLLHETFGYNYRMTGLSIAIASQQLFRLDAFNDARIKAAARLNEAFGNLPGFHGPSVPNGHRHVYHMYRFRFDPSEAGLRITTDQMREALKKVFWAEGLPVVEFQNAPLARHALLQRRIGYGGGCPWSCHGRDDLRYHIEDSPGALQAIRDSLVIGYPAQAPLTNATVVDAYIQCVKKIGSNLHAIERIGRDLPSSPPWMQPPRLF
jgi:dTDP-4-amino-4,6-dideoxygalactose transaminase